MDLNKKNMKNIMLLIVFAVLFYVGVQRIESVAAGFSFVVSIVFPFLLGAAMAFILNVPMSFMEKDYFRKQRERQKTETTNLPCAGYFICSCYFMDCTFGGYS